MELAISKFDNEVQQKIIEKMNKEYLSTGKYIKDQMSVSPKILSSAILSGGVVGTAASSVMSSSLFIIGNEINPATLMTIGAGKGSAVIGAGGKIASHASFIPAAGAIVPVVAPLMAVHALSSVAMLHQLSTMDKKLDAIKGSIDKMMARLEVTNLAELFTAVRIVDEIYSQLEQSGYVSTDMLIRLALAERDAIKLFMRYEMLENANTTDEVVNNFDSCDTYCTMLASFLNLRVKYLRLRVDIQENPQFIHRSSENLTELLGNNISLWDKLLNKSDKMKNEIEKLDEKVKNANFLKKFTRTAEKELSQKKDKYTEFMENERVILKDFHSLIDTAKQMNETKNTQIFPTLIYWRDNEGEHCIATQEQVLDIAA